MKSFGAGEADVAAWTAEEEDEEHGFAEPGQEAEGRLQLLKANGPAVRLFHALTTQWRRGAFGHLAGLDYAAIAPTAALMEIETGPDLFGRLRVMEGEALRAIAEQNDRR